MLRSEERLQPLQAMGPLPILGHSQGLAMRPHKRLELTRTLSQRCESAPMRLGRAGWTWAWHGALPVPVISCPQLPWAVPASPRGQCFPSMGGGGPLPSAPPPGHHSGKASVGEGSRVGRRGRGGSGLVRGIWGSRTSVPPTHTWIGTVIHTAAGNMSFPPRPPCPPLPPSDWGVIRLKPIWCLLHSRPSTVGCSPGTPTMPVGRHWVRLCPG